MYLTWLSSLTELLPMIAVVFGIAISIFAVGWVVIRTVRYIWVLRVKTGCLEVTPPAHGERSLSTVNQLFIALHGLGSASTVYEKLIGTNTPFTFEIKSSKTKGIRYFIYCPIDKLAGLERLVNAHIPDAKVTRLKDVELVPPKARIVSYKQKKHYAFPLKDQTDNDSQDSISFLTSALANPTNDEQIAYQLVTRPIFSREAESIAHKILDNEDLLNKLQQRKVNAKGFFNLTNKFLFGILDGVGSMYVSDNRSDYMMSKRDYEYKKQVAKRIKPMRTLSYFEHELMESIHKKLSEPIFSVDMRVLVHGETKASQKERLKNIHSALSLFNVPKYQKLVQTKVQDKLKTRWLRYKFSHQLPSIARKSVFSSAELASMFHFPNRSAGRIDNVSNSLSKTLAAPTALKNGQKLAVTIGKNVHHGTETPIGLTAGERERHMYVVGGTGNGKTTMLLYSIVQDIREGNGVAVLDPHGDLAETILGYVPEDRIKDVVYLNPDDLEYPIGLNLLELTPGLSGDELIREKDLITESTISVLRKIFSEDDTGGHRIEYVLRNTIQTALTLENPTLFTIFRLLNDTKYRQAVVRGLEDKDLKIFWQNEIAKAGEMQKVKMAAGITSKIGRFLFSGSARKILEQEKSTINFEDIINSKKILICNFSKGLIGEDTSTLFGTTVLAKLQVASLRRARQKQLDRLPFYLYVDEFQNFATMSFVQMLSEARKYKLFLTMAEQSTQQQDQARLVDIILANVGTVVAFRSGSPADERFILPLFKPYINEGEIANLPAYNFYMRIAAVDANEPLSGVTVLLDSEPDEDIARQATMQSRKQYGRKVKVRKKLKKNVKTVVEEHSPESTSRVARPGDADQFAVAEN